MTSKDDFFRLRAYGYRFAAQDYDGAVYAYADKPFLRLDAWYSKGTQHLVTHGATNKNFRHTLINLDEERLVLENGVLLNGSTHDKNTPSNS